MPPPPRRRAAIDRPTRADERPSREPDATPSRSAADRPPRPSPSRADPDGSSPTPRPRRRRSRPSRTSRHRRRARRRPTSRPAPTRTTPTRRRRRPSRRPEPEPSDRPREPSTVAELIAATLRAAGVRLAFTVAGESFLGMLDALAAAGIRIVATRHEGAAAFAAEAYGQLTGRPAAVPRHARRRRREPRHRHPHRHRRLDADVRHRRRGRPPAPRPRGVPGGRPRRRRSAAWRSGPGELDDPATAASVARGRRPGDRRGPPRPGPARASPRTSRTCGLPEGTRVPVVRPHPEAPDRRRPPRRAPLPGRGGAPGDPRRGRRAPRPLLERPRPVRRAAPRPGHRRLAARRRDPQRPPAVPGHGRLRQPARRPRAARDGRRAAGARLAPQRADHASSTRCRRWASAGCTWTSSRATGAVGFAAPPERAIRADARAFLRAANARLKEAVLLAEPVAARDGHNAADRAAWEAATVVDAGGVGRARRPSRAGSSRTLRRLLPDDAILTTDAGAFGGWAARGFRFRRPGTFLGPDVGRDGLRLPGGARGGARPPRAAGRGAGRRRRHGHDAGRGRDGGARGRPRRRDRLRQRALRDDPRPTRSRPGSEAAPGDGPRPARLRRRGAGVRRARRPGRDRRRVRGGAADRARGVGRRRSSSSRSTAAGSASTSPRPRTPSA